MFHYHILINFKYEDSVFIKDLNLKKKIKNENIKIY